MNQHWHTARLICVLVAGTLGPVASAFPATQTVIDPNGIRASGSVIDDHIFYQIGGGRAVSTSSAPGMLSIGVGIGWNTNLICGDMSLKTTLHNQLNGITDGFSAIMSDIINKLLRPSPRSPRSSSNAPIQGCTTC